MDAAVVLALWAVVLAPYAWDRDARRRAWEALTRAAW